MFFCSFEKFTKGVSPFNVINLVFFFIVHTKSDESELKRYFVKIVFFHDYVL